LSLSTGIAAAPTARREAKRGPVRRILFDREVVVSKMSG
jgi:hypothetical protein